jgi:hypothetical protein
MDNRSTFPDSCFETEENVMPKRALWRHFGMSVGRVGIQNRRAGIAPMNCTYSGNYREARSRFRAATRDIGAELQAHLMQGAQDSDESLTIDVARVGAANPSWSYRQACTALRDSWDRRYKYHRYGS